jgi:hypothetical protein
MGQPNDTRPKGDLRGRVGEQAEMFEGFPFGESSATAGFMEGYDDCLVGMVDGLPCYSRAKVIEKLVGGGGMDCEGAVEFHYRNQDGLPGVRFLDTPSD